jgi:hypothetical protein
MLNFLILKRGWGNKISSVLKTNKTKQENVDALCDTHVDILIVEVVQHLFENYNFHEFLCTTFHN